MSLAAALALFAGALTATAAHATDPATRDATPPPFHREVWSGADVSHNSWLVYSGLTLAPWSGIHDDGVRFRFAGGYGKYDWKGSKPVKNGERIRGSGVTSSGDMLVGYLLRLGPLTAKAFAGISYSSHTVTELYQPLGEPLSPGEEPFNGAEFGAKAAIELWLDLNSTSWSSLDLGWTNAHDTYAARLRLGWRALPTVSFGGEAILNGDSRYKVGRLLDDPDLNEVNRRVGGFARYEWFGGEVSVAGGLSYVGALAPKPYVTANWITQF